MLVDASSYVLNQANKELIEIARRGDPSILRQRSFNGLSSETWMAELINEITTRCPMAHQILSGLLKSTAFIQRRGILLCA